VIAVMYTHSTKAAACVKGSSAANSATRTPYRVQNCREPACEMAGRELVGQIDRRVTSQHAAKAARTA
jgi:hypothetical protein